MKPAGIFLILVIFCSCFPARLHRLEQEVKFMYDAEGRLLARTFTQVVNSQYSSGVATITRQYDSAGKLTSEMGFNHSILGNKYMLTYHYMGETLHTINHFRWGDIPVDSSFANPEANLISEIAYSQSDLSEKIQIQLAYVNDTIRKASWKKQIRNGNVYEFVSAGEKLLHTRNIILNTNGRLEL